jgi:hypothetical protein
MRIEVEFDAKDFLNQLQRTSREVTRTAETAMNDATDEIIRIASEITPFDKGILAKSHTRKVRVNKREVTAEISFSVREGDFNYALWTHEGIYNHGEGTMRRSGTVGWSGKRYYAGRKYLERPVKGEQQAVRKYIADSIKDVLGG